MHKWHLRQNGRYQRGTAHRDFKVQRNGIITWTNFQGFDQNFNYLRSFGAVNGYGTDNHELKVLENGHYLLFGVRGQSVDMTRFVSRPPGNEYANRKGISSSNGGPGIIMTSGWFNTGAMTTIREPPGASVSPT
jgi:hypothetical protein